MGERVNVQPPRSDNKKRFKTVSEEELRELQERKQSISTKKNTKWSVRLFQGDLSCKKYIPLLQPIINWNKPRSGSEPECLMRTRIMLSIKLSRSGNTDRLTKSKTLNYFPTYISPKILVLQHFLIYIKTK